MVGGYNRRVMGGAFRCKAGTPDVLEATVGALANCILGSGRRRICCGW